MKKSRVIVINIITVVALFFLLTGFNCNKTFMDYDCIWYSENPYIYFATDMLDATIEVNGEKIEVDIAGTYDGTRILFQKKSNEGHNEEDIIWYTKSEIKDGKLYLTIIKDNVSDYEGKTIVLEQIELEETEDTDK